MVTKYEVYTQDGELVGRLLCSSEVIAGLFWTQFLPDSTRLEIPAYQIGNKVYDETKKMVYGRLKGRPHKEERKVCIRQTMGVVEFDQQFPPWEQPGI